MSVTHITQSNLLHLKHYTSMLLSSTEEHRGMLNEHCSLPILTHKINHHAPTLSNFKQIMVVDVCYSRTQATKVGKLTQVQTSLDYITKPYLKITTKGVILYSTCGGVFKASISRKQTKLDTTIHICLLKINFSRLVFVLLFATEC